VITRNQADPQASAKSRRGHSSARWSSILLVDDDPALSEALSNLFRLRLADVTVEACLYAPDAVDRLTVQDYGAVLTDLRMPSLNGEMLLQQARCLRSCTPIILITAERDRSVGERALHAGAYDVMWKPIDRGEIVAVVREALAVHRLSHRMEQYGQRMDDLRGRLRRLEAIIQARLELAARWPEAISHRRQDRTDRLVQRLTKEVAGTDRLCQENMLALTLIREARLLQAWYRLSRTRG
jgi:FixJ family two-component response regulator